MENSASRLLPVPLPSGSSAGPARASSFRSSTPRPDKPVSEPYLFFGFVKRSDGRRWEFANPFAPDAPSIMATMLKM